MYIFISYGLIICFLLAVIFISYWASKKNSQESVNFDVIMLANRSLGLIIGSCSLTATWTGGTHAAVAEIVASPNGLLWCQAPFGYGLSLVVGGKFFVAKMRNSGYRTMMDPFLLKYGDLMHCLLHVVVLIAQLTWTAGSLNALAASIQVILKLNSDLAVIVSAVTVTFLTIVGGMYAVVYLNLFLLCVMSLLWVCVPVVLLDRNVRPITENMSWVGQIHVKDIFIYIDTFLLLVFGGIPWQGYWQYILAAQSADIGKRLSYIGAISTVIFSVPAIILGAAATNAAWNNTEYGLPKLDPQSEGNTLPLVLLHFAPSAITYTGLASIVGGAMASSDSALLSSAGMFARNIVGLAYFRIYNEKLSQATQIAIMRMTLMIMTTFSCIVALMAESTYGLWVICSDLVYVILFPQLLCVLHVRRSNAYGSFASFVLGLTIRILGGEQLLNVPAVIKYPWYEPKYNFQRFPVKTFSMVISLVTLVGVSYLTSFIFRHHYLPMSFDIFRCFRERHAKPSEAISTFVGSVEYDASTVTEVKAPAKPVSLVPRETISSDMEFPEAELRGANSTSV